MRTEITHDDLIPRSGNSAPYNPYPAFLPQLLYFSTID